MPITEMLNRLSHLRSERAAIDAEVAKLERILTGTEGTISRILELTARTFGVSEEQMLSRKRTSAVATARMIAMALIREYVGISYPNIGRRFGRDHSTVINAIKFAKTYPCQATIKRIRDGLAAPVESQLEQANAA